MYYQIIMTQIFQAFYWGILNVCYYLAISQNIISHLINFGIQNNILSTKSRQLTLYHIFMIFIFINKIIGYALFTKSNILLIRYSKMICLLCISVTFYLICVIFLIIVLGFFVRADICTQIIFLILCYLLLLRSMHFLQALNILFILVQLILLIIYLSFILRLC
ncbi:transmembrane protein, putative (macronuclear) [Tetrahymena thermophila SB210]|uniref:Transmembrane protein, putative n=1 Tax=Tetrahymena thermophila (strain SB210) TaxID=312017 RepID=W7X280_TETTS|nr:transmembrane protein, putative [Tetrahymena thermophila SB210]EWS71742.1 transmembrane protein, putative [Tetrahymena thermophila SB210]|eukprot:XP_012655728.1 transmembrane protein, putative [Tetrahymena thermophila SB210]